MRVLRNHAVALSAGVSGILAYVFFSLATRSLGAVDAAPVSVLWTYWSFTAATLTFPLQHWISRSVAAHGTEAPVRRALKGVLASVVALSVAVGALAWLLRQPLFHSDTKWYPVLVAAVTVGAATNGVLRGVLTARERFPHVGAALVGENGIRVVAAGLLVALGLHSPVGFALCLAAGPLVGLGWPSSWRLSDAGDDGHRESALAPLTGSGGGQLMSQFVLTGAPVVLALAGGRPGVVTAVFVTLALFRAPYTVAVGAVAQLTGRLTTLVVEGRTALLTRVQVATASATVASAVLGAAGAAWLGMPVVRLVFGPGISLGRGPVMMLAAGSVVALGNLVLTILLIALGRSGRVATAWGVGLLAGVVAFVVAGTEVERTCAAFMVAEATALLAAFLLARPGARSSAR